MLIRHIALVSQIAAIDFAGLARVSAAIQKQVIRDFAPVWEVTATVDPFPTVEDVPVGYWPIVVTAAALENNAFGLHLDPNGQPAAWVEWSESWSITASHECLEMLADPWGNQLKTSRALDDDEQRVEYLVEVCDPCQHANHAYHVNDVLVSEFYTPAYFDRVARAGTRYSANGAIERPLQVLEGGYLSWHDPVTNDWWQVHSGDAPRCLGKMAAGMQGMRGRIDALSGDHLAATQLARERVLANVGARHQQMKRAGKVRAEWFRAHEAEHQAKETR